MKIKKGDTVKIISGNYKGRVSKVLRVFKNKNQVLVEGVNIHKKFIKPKREGEKGQIVNIPLPINVSNVMLVCPNCKKPTRVGYHIIKVGKNKKNKKVRVCKKCNSEI